MKKKPDKLNDMLDDIANHLGQRILKPEGDDVFTVSEETAAFKSLQSYYAMKHKLPDPASEKGGFAGHAHSIRNLGNGARSHGNSNATEADF